MVASILATRGPALKTQGNLNNEIGVPLTLFNLEARHVAAVIEMGMNHAGEISRLADIARPDAGLITVVQPAHLEGLGSIEGVAKAKGELFFGLRKGATAVVNLDDPRVASQAKRASGAKAAHLRPPRGRGSSEECRSSLRRAGFRLTLTYLGRTFEVKLKFLGAHNALNAAAAIALCIALGYRPEECVQGLEQVQAYARRLQVNTAPAGFTVIDDCYNANPSSMLAALETLASVSDKAHAVAVLGDMLEVGAGEQQEHTQMGEKAPEYAGTFAFFGPRMKHAYEAARPRLGEKAAHFLEVAPLLAWLAAIAQKRRGAGEGPAAACGWSGSSRASPASGGCRRLTDMLYLLYEWLKDGDAARYLNFLKYPTFRIVAAGIFVAAARHAGRPEADRAAALSRSTASATCAKTRPSRTRRRRARRRWAAL